MRQICGHESYKIYHKKIFRWEFTDDLLIGGTWLKQVHHSIVHFLADIGVRNTVGHRNDLF